MKESESFHRQLDRATFGKVGSNAEFAILGYKGAELARKVYGIPKN